MGRPGRLGGLTGTGAVGAYLAANHSYATPELIAPPITSGLPGYLRWIGESLQ